MVVIWGRNRKERPGIRFRHSPNLRPSEDTRMFPHFLDGLKMDRPGGAVSIKWRASQAVLPAFRLRNGVSDAGTDIYTSDMILCKALHLMKRNQTFSS